MRTHTRTHDAKPTSLLFRLGIKRFKPCVLIPAKTEECLQQKYRIQNKYDQEKPQSQTEEEPMAFCERVTDNS